MRVVSILGAVLCSHLAHGYYGGSTKGATSPYRLYSNSKAGTKGTVARARDEYFDDYFYEEMGGAAPKKISPADIAKLKKACANKALVAKSPELKKNCAKLSKGSKARDEYFDEAYFDYYFDEPAASAGKTKQFAARENYFDDAYYYDDEYDEEYDAEYYDEYDEAYDMYEEAAENLQRAQEEFAIAQQILGDPAKVETSKKFSAGAEYFDDYYMGGGAAAASASKVATKKVDAKAAIAKLKKACANKAAVAKSKELKANCAKLTKSTGSKARFEYFDDYYMGGGPAAASASKVATKKVDAKAAIAKLKKACSNKAAVAKSKELKANCAKLKKSGK